MSEKARQQGSDDDAEGMLYSLPQTILHSMAHVCPICDIGMQVSDVKLQYEYSQLRDKYLRLESKYQSLQARELRLNDHLPKLAQYELAALPHPWTAHLHTHGRTFYFNHETGVSSWHDPRQVASPKVEGCPQLLSSIDTNRLQPENVNSELQDEINVEYELWHSDSAETEPLTPRSRPSAAKLTGLPSEEAKATLSDFEFHLPLHSYDPAEEQGRAATRQSKTAIDTPEGSRMHGKLQVSGPTLVSTRPTKASKLQSEPIPDDSAFLGNLRTVALDGDRLWLSTLEDDSTLHEEQEHTNMESIPLWKAKLEILYPEKENVVGELLWGEGGTSSFFNHDERNSKSDNPPSEFNKGETEETTANSNPHIFATPFTRWRIYDRLSRLWIFQSRTRSEARQWVMSMTHNMVLVDSGRIRPSIFHILAPQPGSVRTPSNETAASLLQLKAELQHANHMLEHARVQLRKCLKSQRSRLQHHATTNDVRQLQYPDFIKPPLSGASTEGHGLTDVGDGQSRSFGNLVQHLDSAASNSWLRQVLQMPTSRNEEDNDVSSLLFPLSSEPNLNLPAPHVTSQGQNSVGLKADHTLKEKFQAVLKDTGSALDQTCPSLYSTYVSFLRAQVFFHQ